MVSLYHSIPRGCLDQALRAGLKAASAFDDLGVEMRRGVVYCFLSPADDVMSSGGQRAEYVYLTVTVEAERCTVAEMQWSSLALMYRQGQMRPPNAEASRLLAELYRVTAVPPVRYKAGMFFTPEVLVEGDIAPECLSLAIAPDR